MNRGNACCLEKGFLFEKLFSTFVSRSKIPPRDIVQETTKSGNPHPTPYIPPQHYPTPHTLHHLHYPNTLTPHTTHTYIQPNTHSHHKTPRKPRRQPSNTTHHHTSHTSQLKHVKRSNTLYNHITASQRTPIIRILNSDVKRSITHSAQAAHSEEAKK